MNSIPIHLPHTGLGACPDVGRCTANYCPLTPFRRQESGPLCPYLIATQQPYETPCFRNAEHWQSCCDGSLRVREQNRKQWSRNGALWLFIADDFTGGGNPLRTRVRWPYEVGKVPRRRVGGPSEGLIQVGAQRYGGLLAGSLRDNVALFRCLFRSPFTMPYAARHRSDARRRGFAGVVVTQRTTRRQVADRSV